MVTAFVFALMLGQDAALDGINAAIDRLRKLDIKISSQKGVTPSGIVYKYQDWNVVWFPFELDRLGTYDDFDDYPVSLRMEYSYVPSRMPSDAMLMRYARSFAYSGITFSPGWDGTLSIRTRTFRPSIMPDGEIQIICDRISQDLKTILVQVPPAQHQSPRSPSEVPFDESQKIDYLDEARARFLIMRWGWEYKHDSGGSGPTWGLPCDWHGITFFLSGAHPGRSAPFQIDLSARLDMTEKELEEAKRSLKPLTVGYMGFERTSVSTVIDLREGIRIRDLKRTIESFVRKIEPYATPRARATSPTQGRKTLDFP